MLCIVVAEVMSVAVSVAIVVEMLVRSIVGRVGCGFLSAAAQSRKNGVVVPVLLL